MCAAMERRNSEPVVEQRMLLNDPDYARQTLFKLNSLRAQAWLTDIVLCVGHEEFPCHRNVLAVSSPYFQAMFSSDLRESQEAKICFSDVSPWIMRRVIEYAYTGSVEITVDNAQELLAAGNLFQYPAIVEACCDFLRKHLHPSNCLGIENFAHLHDCADLETDAHRYVLENFSAVIEHDEFLELSLPRLLSYLASDLIDVRTEEIVYVAAMNWVRQDTDKRASFIKEVLSEVRLATVDIHYLETVVQNDPLIAASDACIALIEHARQNHVSLTLKHGQRRRSVQEAVIQPRPSTVAKEVMVLVGGINNFILTSVEMYEPHKDKWTFLPELPTSVSCHSVCAFHNDIYVMGGISDGHIVANVWKFESAQRKWTKTSRLRTARARHASAACDGRLYVVGGVHLGRDGNLVPTEDIECFTVDTGEWSVVGEAPFPRKHSQLVPYKGTLLEVGGMQSSGPSKGTLDTYLCEDGRVKTSGEQFILPEAIEFAQMAVLDDILYIVWEDTKQVIALDPQRRSFRRLADMHQTHIHGSCTVLNGKLYVTGGMADSKGTRYVECYDPATNVWTKVKAMRHSRAHHGCATIRMS